MHFGSTLDLSNIDLWNIDLLDTHLNLLDTDISRVLINAFWLTKDLRNVNFLDTHLDLLGTDIPSKHFFISKTSWRRLQDMFLRRLQDMSSRRFQDVFSVTIFCLPRRLARCVEDVLKKKNFNAEDVLKTSLRLVFKTSSRRLEDQLMFAGLVHVRCTTSKTKLDI